MSFFSFFSFLNINVFIPIRPVITNDVFHD